MVIKTSMVTFTVEKFTMVYHDTTVTITSLLGLELECEEQWPELELVAGRVALTVTVLVLCG